MEMLEPINAKLLMAVVLGLVDKVHATRQEFTNLAHRCGTVVQVEAGVLDENQIATSQATVIHQRLEIADLVVVKIEGRQVGEVGKPKRPLETFLRIMHTSLSISHRTWED